MKRKQQVLIAGLAALGLLAGACSSDSESSVTEAPVVTDAPTVTDAPVVTEPNADGDLVQWALDYTEGTAGMASGDSIKPTSFPCSTAMSTLLTARSPPNVTDIPAVVKRFNCQPPLLSPQGTLVHHCHDFLQSRSERYAISVDEDSQKVLRDSELRRE